MACVVLFSPSLDLHIKSPRLFKTICMSLSTSTPGKIKDCAVKTIHGDVNAIEKSFNNKHRPPTVRYYILDVIEVKGFFEVFIEQVFREYARENHSSTTPHPFLIPIHNWDHNPIFHPPIGIVPDLEKTGQFLIDAPTNKIGMMHLNVNVD